MTSTSMQMSSANSKAMVAGFALVAAGGVIAMAGAGISTTAMVNAVRRWVRAQQEPPAAIVKRKISQAKAATTAGASAWQNGMATSARS
jgi:hypothetical protein